MTSGSARSREIQQDNVRLRAEVERLQVAVLKAQQAEEHRAFLENTTDLVTIVDHLGRFTYVNHACETAFGLPTEELIGALAFEFVHPDDRENTRRAFGGWVQRRVRSASFENRQVSKDGTVRVFLWTIMPRYGVTGEVESVWSIARDITALREAERRLRESEHRYWILAESAPDMVFVVERDGVLSYLNRAAAAAHGANPEDLLGKPLSAVFPPHVAQHQLRRITEVIETGQPSGDVGAFPVGGKMRHLDTAFVPIRGEDGMPRAVMGVSRDVTERIELQEHLRERVKELRCLCDVSAAVGSDAPEPEMLTAIATLIPSGSQCPHRTRACIEVDGRVYGDERPARALETGRAMSAELVTGEKARGQVLVWRTGHDEKEGAPFLDEERDLLDAIARIISEAIDRRDAATQFRHLLERAPIPLCLVNEQDELVFPNARFNETFGYTPEELPTLKEWWLLAYPDEEYRKWVVHTWSEAVQKAAALGTDVEPCEYRVTCKDGSTRIMEISGVVIGKSFLATFVDLTARREAEEVLRNHRDRLEEEVLQRTRALSERTRELELSNRELNAFAYSVSHDLRAPLRSITGFTHAVLQDYGDKLDADGKDYLERSAAAARRMGQLIDDLLTLSRITRSEMRPTDVNLSALVHEVISELRSHHTTWQGHIDVQRGIAVCADRQLLQHAIRNLLDNALKFSAKIPEPRVSVGSIEHDGGTAVFVKDNGAGFDMAYADNLFTPFHRLHKETEFLGTGIGLSIVQRIVRMHGGRVWAESAPGRGATFYLTLAVDADPERTEEG